MSSVASIVIVDNYPLVREGLKRIIQGESYFSVCGETGRLREAKALVRAKRPDILIVDLILQDGDGLELIRELKSEYPEMKILVCSMLDGLLFSEPSLSAGAHGFIDKAEAAKCIVEALRQVCAGRLFFRPCLLDRLVDSPVGNQPKPRFSTVGLTA